MEKMEKEQASENVKLKVRFEATQCDYVKEKVKTCRFEAVEQSKRDSEAICVHLYLFLVKSSGWILRTNRPASV